MQTKGGHCTVENGRNRQKHQEVSFYLLFALLPLTKGFFQLICYDCELMSSFLDIDFVIKLNAKRS